MSEEPTTDESLMNSASEEEKHWNWLGAAEAYEKALKLMPDGDHQRMGNILERKAYAFHRAALQADTDAQFEKRIQEATECYAKAKQAYERATGPAVAGWKHRCDAMTSYLQYWLAHDSEQKKKLANKAWKEAKSSLSVFEAAGISKEFALTFNQLSYAAAFSYNYDGEAEGRENVLREVLSYADKSIRYLSALNDNENLARAHAKAAGLLVAIETDFTPFNLKDKVDLDALNHWLKARELAEEVALCETPFIVILQSWPAACSTDERSAIYTKAMETAEKTRDHFMMGCVLDGLAQRKFLTAMAADDMHQMESLSKEGFEAAKVSQENLAKVRFISPNVICVWIHLPEAGYYFSLSSEQRDPKLKRELLYKAQHPSMEQLRLAEESGYPDVRCASYFILGSVLKELGKTESGIDQKRSYLEHAVENLKIAINEDRRIHPHEYYPQGLDLLSLAEAHFEIAQITTNVEKKTSILREAVSRKQEALDLCEKELISCQDSNAEISSEIAEGYRTTGNWAKELCSISSDNSCLGLVAECLEKAVVWYSKAGLWSQSAETNWEAAQVHDKLGEFLKASERFDLAAEDYRKAAENVPRLDEFYADHAIYMQAWGEIERARYRHLRQEPGQAKEHYENASAMHKSSRRWAYLATNYLAWAEIEHAEDLSRSENYEEAMKAFEDADRLFHDSKASLHDQVQKIEDSSEKQMARDLERAADTRRSYCKARIILEKARCLDKQGDALASSEKYGQAAEHFEKMSPELGSDQDKREVELMSTLSRAWQAMARAEAETSPDYYEKASEFFDKAKDLSTGEKARLMVAGHSRFCKALCIGARLVEKGDIALHAEATKQMESAADYYLKAGHQTESDYAKASKLLFDGYVHMGKASAEEDQEKKAKLYMMAEKVFHTSAEAYEKAKQPSKKIQVLRLLEKVREEKDLALSLTNMIRAPDVFSSTAAFPTPTPSHETTTGLEKFEHADVQLTLIVHPKHLHVGQELDVEVEMTNAGKGVAKLARIEGILPKGFEILEKPEACRVEHDHLTLKNKSIDALRTEVVRLVLKPTSKGVFSLRPHLFYGDETGTHKDRVADPVEITVSEMGLAGWLKGPDKKR